MDQLAITFLTWLIGSYPITASALTIIGILRVVNKPLFSLLRAYVTVTKNEADDKALDAVEKSKLYTYLTYILDWLGSVKLK